MTTLRTVVIVVAVASACASAPASAPAAAPLPTLAPAVRVETAPFEGEIEYAITTEPADLYAVEFRRDVLRAAPGRARWTACAMGVSCGPLIVDRPANRMWFVVDEAKVYVEHDLKVFFESLNIPMDAEPRESGPKKTFDDTGAAVVATIPCRELRMKSADGGGVEACATRAPEFAELTWAFSKILLSSPVYSWFSMLAPLGWFPLRIKFMGQQIVAVRVSRQRMADSVFAPPPGYKKSE